MIDLFESRRRARHRDVWELLPWLVNGTLPEAQTVICERHLAECVPCRTEYREQQSLREHIQAEEAVVHTPHAGLRRLLDRIEQDELAEPAPPVRADSRRTRWLAAAVVLQSVGLIGLASFMTWRLNDIREAPRYSTLSSPPATLAAEAAARVVFYADALSVTQLNQLLQRYHAQIIAGPNAFGVYTLAFPGMDPKSVATTVEQLSTDPHVRFAELADSGNSK